MFRTMARNIPYPRGNALLKFVGPIVGGVPIGVIVSTLPPRWSIAVFGGLLTLLPALVVKNVRLYGLGLFLFLLMMEGDTAKNLTKQLVDGNELMDTMGIPPARSVGVMLRPSDIVFLCLMLSWFLRILTRRDRIQLSGFGWLALTYLGWASLSSFLKAPYPFLSIAELVQQAKYFLLFVYVANAVDRRALVKGLMGVLMFCLFVEGVVTLAGLKYEPARNPLSFLSSPSQKQLAELPPAFENDSSGQKRAVGTFGDYAITAVYLHFLLPLALIQLLINLGNRMKWQYLLLLALGVGSLWFTYSRTGLVAGAFGLVSCVYLSYRRGFVSNRLFFLITYAGIVSVLTLSPMVAKYLESRPANLESRFPIMKEAVRMIADNPVFGVGLNNSTVVRKESFVRTLEQEIQEQDLQPIHNQYLVVASETGLIGLILSMVFFILIGKEAARQIKATNLEIASFSLAILSTFAALAIHLLFDPIASYRIYAMMFFYAGLIVAFRRMEQAPLTRT